MTSSQKQVHFRPIQYLSGPFLTPLGVTHVKRPRNSFKGPAMYLMNSLTTNLQIVSDFLEGLPFLAKGQDSLVANDTCNVSPHVIILHDSNPFVNSVVIIQKR
jgi:hypothetical protein